MGEYLQQIRGFQRDIRLFLLYNLFANVGFGVFQLIFNLYLTELRLREDDIGAFTAAQTLSMAAVSASLGMLFRRFGLWRCIFSGVILFLFSSYGLAFAEHPTPLLLLSATNGAGLAFMFTGTMPFIIEWVRRDQRQHVAAISFSVISLSTTVGALVGGFLPGVIPASDVGVFRWTLVIGSTIGAIGLAPLLLMGPARAGRGPADPTAAREAEGPAERRQVRRDVSVFVLIGGLMALGAGMVMPFYNVYLTTLGASSQEIGYIFALGGLCAATVGLAAPALSRRYGSLRAVPIVRLSVVPFYVMLIVSPTVGIAVLAHIVRQTSISMAWPIDSTFIADVLPPRARASVYGLRSAAWNVGFSVASLIGGAIIVNLGYDVTFAGLIVFSSLSMVLFVGYYTRHPRIRSGEIPAALPRATRLARERAINAAPPVPTPPVVPVAPVPVSPAVPPQPRP